MKILQTPLIQMFLFFKFFIKDAEKKEKIFNGRVHRVKQGRTLDEA